MGKCFLAMWKPQCYIVSNQDEDDDNDERILVTVVTSKLDNTGKYWVILSIIYGNVIFS